MSAARRSHPRRLLTGLSNILAALGLVALFGFGATSALLLHLNLPASRRVTADAVGQLLAGLLQGHLSIGSLSRVRPYEVVAEDIVVRDAARRIVLKVTRLTARADLLDILKRLLRGDAKLTITINHVRIERAEAYIVPDEEGIPTIAEAFTPRPTPPEPPGPDRGEYVRVWLPAVEIGEAFGRGNVAGSPTLEANVTGVHGSVLVTPKGAAIDISRFALVTKGVGGTDARGIASLHIRAPGAVWGSLDGYMGDVQFGAAVRYDEELDVKLDVPRADPGAVRALTGSWPLLVPTGARIRAKGKPPDLTVDLNANVGENATVSGSGSLHLAEPINVNLDLEGRKLDLRALWSNAPSTAIDVDTSFGLTFDKDRPVVAVDGTLHRTRVERFDVPSVDFSGSTQTGPFTGEAKLHDIGLPVDASFSVYPDGKLEVDADARRVDLAKAERLRPYFDGNGNADVHVHASLDHGRLDTKLTLDVRDFSYKNVTLQSGRVVANARGPLERVEQIALNAKLTGKRLRAAGLGFENVEATARGPLGAPLVVGQLSEPNGPSVDAQATMGLGGDQVSLRKLSLGVARDGAEIRGDVAQLDLGAERVLLRELRLRGAAGELDGDAALDRGKLSLTAHGKDVDMSAFARVLGLPRGTLEGRVGIDVDLVADKQSQRGTLELTLQRGAVAQLSGISGQLSAKLDDRHLTGDATGKIDGLSDFSADWDGQLAGAPVELGAFEHATGKASLTLKHLALDYLGQLAPEAGVDVGGMASVSLQVSRQDGNTVPDIQATAETNGLLLTFENEQKTPRQVSRIELLASLTHTGATGATTLSFGATRDEKRLLTTTTEMELDLAAAVDGSQPLVAQLQQHSLQSKLIVSEIDLETLPEPLYQPGLRGTVRIEGTVRGTALAPVASLSVRAGSLRFAIGDRGEPIDVCATAEYAKSNGAFNVGAEAFLPSSGLDLRGGACTGKRFATARWTGFAPLDPQRGYVGWTGNLLASLESMPLTTIPQLANNNVSGAVSGRLLLDRSSAQPRASAELSLKQIKVDRLIVGDGTLGLRASDTRARADFSLESSGSSVEGELNAGLSWSTDLPDLDAAQPIDMSLRAKRLQASVLEPFLEDYVAELRGLVDGNLSARLDARAPGATSRELGNLTGQVSLADGSFLISGLGFRLREVGFTATATRDGARTLIDIPAFVATATANANSRTKNLSSYVKLQLRGFDLEGLQARVGINQLPLVMEGVTRATADANFLVEMQRRPEKMFAEITFENLHAKLLKQSTRELIELKEHPNVTVLQPLQAPKARRDEADAPWHFVIHLGPNAKLERSGMLDVRLTGDPNVVLAQELGVTGSIFLQRGGAVQMLGKVFVIEGGGVIFDSADAKDPRLDVQASWRTPDGDTLFVYVAGTVSKPKLRFDRPDEQAWAMLLGGDASDITLTALDTLLADTPLAGVQVRKTSANEEEDEGATYTASYRVGERVIVEGNYQEAQSTGPDDTTAGGVGASVDWRMTKNWSLRGQLGTIGTGVDIVYQYRY